MLTRRKVNIESLTVSETERKGISRFTIVVISEKDLVQKMVKQMNRAIEVVDVFACENRSLLFKEIAFIKVATETLEARNEIEELASRHHSEITYATKEYIVLQATGSEDDIDSLLVLLDGYGVLEFIRSGRIAILKEERAPGKSLLDE